MQEKDIRYITKAATHSLSAAEIQSLAVQICIKTNDMTTAIQSLEGTVTRGKILGAE